MNSKSGGSPSKIGVSGIGSAAVVELNGENAIRLRAIHCVAVDYEHAACAYSLKEGSLLRTRLFSCGTAYFSSPDMTAVDLPFVPVHCRSDIRSARLGLAHWFFNGEDDLAPESAPGFKLESGRNSQAKEAGSLSPLSRHWNE